jgi:hypothetical protein
MESIPHKATANDNDEPAADAIPFSDLALAIGVDEDTLLQRLAGILSRRGVEEKKVE